MFAEWEVHDKALARHLITAKCLRITTTSAAAAAAAAAAAVNIITWYLACYFPPPTGVRVWAGQKDMGAGQGLRHGRRRFGSVVHAKLLRGRGAPRSTEKEIGRRGRKHDHGLGQRARGMSDENPPATMSTDLFFDACTD